MVFLILSEKVDGLFKTNDSHDHNISITWRSNYLNNLYILMNFICAIKTLGLVTNVATLWQLQVDDMLKRSYVICSGCGNELKNSIAFCKILCPKTLFR
jgi:hypothetical protein